MRKYLNNIGPGILVTAAFIGPGTVTVCLLAGNSYTFQLLWAILFSVAATIILQEMSARLGLVTKAGLSEAIRTLITNKISRNLVFGLIATGILMGNAAYEAGNISGTMIGLKVIFGPSVSELTYNTVIYSLSGLLLYFGSYKNLENFFIAIVGLMSICFIAASVITHPPVPSIMHGLFYPQIPDGSILTIVGLVGTTVVPYNLFLHAAIIKNKWQNTSDLSAVRKDTFFAILIGGVISACIIITGASTTGTSINSISDLALSFDNIYGKWGSFLFGFGIFAAGFTSTLTAPLAAAMVARGLMGWKDDIKDYRFRMVWLSILTAGFLFSSVGYKPIEIIKLAQFANGLLLPLIAVFLIWVVNQQKVMGAYKNTYWQNWMGCIVLLVTILLGIKGIAGLF